MGSDGKGRAGGSCKTTARTVVMIPEEKLLRRKSVVKIRGSPDRRGKGLKTERMLGGAKGAAR